MSLEKMAKEKMQTQPQQDSDSFFSTSGHSIRHFNGRKSTSEFCG
jgi:hypothetical protein